MTQCRREYLKRCNVTEQVLRGMIAITQGKITEAKRILTQKEIVKPTWDRDFWKQEIAGNKILLNAYRHELARLKGMDRVVRVKIRNWIYGINCVIGTCKCGNDVYSETNYCSACGRKLLWEKYDDE